MRSIRHRLYTMVALAVSVAGVSRSFAAGPIAPLADKVPGTVVFYGGWAGTDALQGAYNKSTLKGLIDATNLPQNVADAVADLMSKYGPQPGSEQADKVEVGKAVMTQLSGLQHYPIALFLMPFDPAATEPGKATTLGILIDAGKDTKLVEGKLKALLQNAPPQVKMVQKGSLFQITSGLDLPAKFTPLSTQPGFLKTLASAKMSPSTDAYVQYANITPLLDALKKALPGKTPNAESVLAAIKNLGLEQLGQAASHGGFTTTGWEDAGFVEVKQPRTGILTFLNGKGITDTDLAMVPLNANVVTVTNVDIGASWKAIREAISTADAEWDQQLNNALATAKTETGFDLEALTGAFGDSWIGYKVAGGSFVAINTLKDAAAATTALDAAEKMLTEQLANRPQFSMHSTEIDGLTIKSVQVQTQQFAWAIADGKFYLSSDPRLLAKATKSIDKAQSILANADFLAMRQQLTASAKGGTILNLSYNDLRKTVPEALMSARMLVGMANMFGAGISAEVIPTPEQVAPFLAPAGSVIWTDPSGVHTYDRGPFPGGQFAEASKKAKAGDVPTAFAGMVTPEFVRLLSNAEQMNSAQASAVR